MKKHFFFQTTFCLFIILSVFVFLPFCKKSDVPYSASATAENNSIAAIQQAVANSFGLPADKVVYDKNDKQFVIAGDGIVSLEDAKARFSFNGITGAANEASQRRYNYLVSSSKVNVIKILADSTVPLSWVTALDEAIVIWNNSGSKVKMQRITTYTGFNTIVTTNYNPATNIVATGTFPDYFGNAGKKVTINTHFNGLIASQKISVLVHEEGHTIGLMHTNESAGSLIRGTPLSDVGSIMNSMCPVLAVLTPYDLLAVKTLYPL